MSKLLVNRGLFSIAVVAALAWSWPAMAQPSPNQADMSIDAKTRADTIASLAKGLRDAYVFPAVAEKLAVSLQQRQARGEYDSVTSAKAFSDLLTQQMFDFTHDKHLRLIYSAQTLPQLPVSKPGETPPPSARMLAQLRIAGIRQVAAVDSKREIAFADEDDGVTHRDAAERHQLQVSQLLSLLVRCHPCFPPVLAGVGVHLQEARVVLAIGGGHELHRALFAGAAEVEEVVDQLLVALHVRWLLRRTH